MAGDDFAIVASDTRLSEGYSIHSRDSPKCYKLWVCQVTVRDGVKNRWLAIYGYYFKHSLSSRSSFYLLLSLFYLSRYMKTICKINSEQKYWRHRYCNIVQRWECSRSMPSKPSSLAVITCNNKVFRDRLIIFSSVITFWCASFLYRTDTTVIGCSGFHGDCLTLTKIIDARLKVGSLI